MNGCAASNERLTLRAFDVTAPEPVYAGLRPVSSGEPVLVNRNGRAGAGTALAIPAPVSEPRWDLANVQNELAQVGTGQRALLAARVDHGLAVDHMDVCGEP